MKPGIMLNPANPIQYENVHVSILVKNQRGIDCGAFKMRRNRLDTFANLRCDWDIVGDLEAGGSVLVECDFTFSSWYPPASLRLGLTHRRSGRILE
jgi:hypothetical protein